MKIFVTSAFSVRLVTGEEPRVFARGAHELSEEEIDHWFVQACIQEGRARVLSGGPYDAVRLEGEFCSMSVPELKKMAVEMGIEAQEFPKKDLLIAAMLGAIRARLGN